MRKSRRISNNARTRCIMWVSLGMVSVEAHKMAMLIRLNMTVTQGVIGNDSLNVFGYKSFVAVTDELNEFLNKFASDIAPSIAAILNPVSYITLLEAFECNGAGYASKTIALPGTRTGTYDPAFSAWGFRYQRKNQGERSGAKRFGWTTDSDFNSGAPISTLVTAANALAVKLQNPIQEGILDTWFPVILKRPKYVNHVPTTAWSSHDLSGVTFTGITTQSSRKR